MPDDEAATNEYGQVLRRVRLLSLILAVAGTIGCAYDGNQRRAISYLGGAAIAGASLWMLHRLVADLGTAMQGKRPRGASMLLHVLRLLILGGATFAMLKLYGAQPGPLAAGLLTPVSAMVLEAVYELRHARN